MKNTAAQMKKLLIALLAVVIAVTSMVPALAVSRSSTLAKSGASYIVTASKLNVRSGPGTSYSVDKVIKKGTKVRYISNEKGWWLISLSNGTKGYVDKQYLTPSSASVTGTYTVKTGLNVRAKPTTKGKILGTLRKGSSVSILKLNGDWGQVSYKGKTGWVALKYLTK